MTSVPYRDLHTETVEMEAELMSAVQSVVTGANYILGPELEAFEQDWAEYCGVRHAVGVGSGLSAIELLLRAHGIGPGDEVIVPAYTFIATWLGVSSIGAVPVPADVQRETGNIDPSAAEAQITSRTVAILAVHLFGTPAPMNTLAGVAARHSLLLLEDASQAHGALYHKRKCGALSDGAAFSFYPTKNLGALGDAGAVTVTADDTATKLRTLRNYGMGSDSTFRERGTNSRLDEIQAAALRVKLRYLDAFNARRRTIAAKYLALLDGCGLGLPQTPDQTDAVWHIFNVRHPERERVRAGLRERGVQTRVYYPTPPHDTDAYRDDARSRDFPVATELARTSLALPCHPAALPAVPRVVEATIGTLEGYDTPAIVTAQRSASLNIGEARLARQVERRTDVTA